MKQGVQVIACLAFCLFYTHVKVMHSQPVHEQKGKFF